MFTKVSALFFSLIILSFNIFAQTVKVKKESTRIKSENTDGFEVELQGTEEEVQSALNKLMKTFGKTKSSDNTIAVAEPLVLGKKYLSPVYALTKVQANTTSAWIGIKKNEWPADADVINQELEKTLYDFGVNFYRDKIQKQVDEATRASLAVERQQQRMLNQNKELTTRLEDNKREKLQLEKQLEENRIEFETLTKKLAQNKKDQDSVAIAGGQIKKVVEMHKDRQIKVN
jgi:hypothetical protein